MDFDSDNDSDDKRNKRTPLKRSSLQISPETRTARKKIIYRKSPELRPRPNKEMLTLEELPTQVIELMDSIEQMVAEHLSKVVDFSKNCFHEAGKDREIYNKYMIELFSELRQEITQNPGWFYKDTFKLKNQVPANVKKVHQGFQCNGPPRENKEIQASLDQVDQGTQSTLPSLEIKEKKSDTFEKASQATEIQKNITAKKTSAQAVRKHLVIQPKNNMQQFI